MASSDSLSDEDKHFLDTCEELLKDRYTQNDEEFMKVFNAEPCKPPIVESWRVPNNGGKRNDRRNNRRHPYSRYGPRGGHGDHSRAYDAQGHGHYGSRPRY